MTTDAQVAVIEGGNAAARIRLREMRPEALWLMLSMCGRHGRLGQVWGINAGSPLTTRLLKALLCGVFKFSPLGNSVRRMMWRRIDPGIEEVNFGTKQCLLREPGHPELVFKLDIESCLHTPASQRRRLVQIEADYQALRERLGDYLESTAFEQREVGRVRPLTATGAVQRFVHGRVFNPARARDRRWLQSQPRLERQWRDICAAASAADPECRLIPDVLGAGNVLVDATTGRLTIVDTKPLVWREDGPAWEREVYRDGFRLLCAGRAD